MNNKWVGIGQKGQNNSISCFNNSISFLAQEYYYHNISDQKWSFDKIPRPKIIYWELGIGQKYSFLVSKIQFPV